MYVYIQIHILSRERNTSVGNIAFPASELNKANHS